MEYQKIANLLENGATLNVSNQPSKFRTKNWVEINDESRGTYSVNRKINLKASLLRSSLCDDSDAYILVEGNISVNNTGVADAKANNANKKVILKNCAPFTDCLSKINSQVDNAKDNDIVMPMYNLIEYTLIIIQKHLEAYGNIV